MAIQVTAKSMEEIPEEMREFVTEDNGVFSYDSGKAFAALKAERESAKSARNALAPYKALNLSAEEIKAFSDLGKSPEELAQMIAKAAIPAAKPNVKDSTINDDNRDVVYTDNHEYHVHSTDHKTTKATKLSECAVTDQAIPLNCAQIQTTEGAFGDNCCELVRLWGYAALPGTFTFTREEDTVYTDDQDYLRRDLDTSKTETYYDSRTYDESQTTTLRAGTHSVPVLTGDSFGWISFAHGRSPSDGYRKLLASVSLNVQTSVTNIPVVTHYVKKRDIEETERSGGTVIPHTPTHVIDADTTTQSIESASFGDSFSTIAHEMDVNKVRNLDHVTIITPTNSG